MSKHGNMTFDAKREEEVNKEGSIEILENRINDENINIGMIEIMKTIPYYTQYMTDRQRVVFRSYYLHRNSIFKIRYNSGFLFRSFLEVERVLEAATIKYLKMIRSDYGMK